ncbi:MAG: GreA/GreB family elongation factor [Kofleriaceae bacterium]
MSNRRAHLKRELLVLAEAALAAARAAHADAVAGATHSEAKAENAKDTRGLEQSYLARGHAARVVEIEAALAQLAQLPEVASGGKIAVGAVVTVDDAGRRSHYYLAPWGGGQIIGGRVAVVTPSSPLGRALAGRQVDDTTEVERPGGRRELEIVAVE